jgi:hypothetical protein
MCGFCFFGQAIDVGAASSITPCEALVRPSCPKENPQVALLRKNRARRTRLPEYTVIRCPFNGYQVSWCRQLCQPIGGRGVCGRPATHGMRGRTQQAIARYQQAMDRY